MLLLLLILGIVLADNSLVMVIEVHRHGARAPVYPLSFPNTFPAWTTTPQLFAEISYLGRRQHFLLGRYIASKYFTLLGITSYDPNLIYSASSSFNRTIDSATSQLMGMFPDGNYAQLSDAQVNNANPPLQVDFTTINGKLGNNATLGSFTPNIIHTADPKRDGVLCPDQGSCPRFNFLSSQVKFSKEWSTEFQAYVSGPGATIATAFGFNASNIDNSNIITVQDITITDTFHGLINGILDQPTLDANLASFQKTFGWVTVGNNATMQAEMPKLGASRILNEIVSFMENKTKHSSPLKFVQLSCHDSNALNIRAAQL